MWRLKSTTSQYGHHVLFVRSTDKQISKGERGGFWSIDMKLAVTTRLV
jgi:hypothetical protein